MEFQRPDHPALGHVHPLPVVAPVVAAVYAPLGSGEYYIWVLGMDRNGPGLGRRGHSPSQVLPTRLAGFFPVDPAGFRADVYQRFVRHRCFLRIFSLPLSEFEVLIPFQVDRSRFVVSLLLFILSLLPLVVSLSNHRPLAIRKSQDDRALATGRPKSGIVPISADGMAVVNRWNSS